MPPAKGCSAGRAKQPLGGECRRKAANALAQAGHSKVARTGGRLCSNATSNVPQNDIRASRNLLKSSAVSCAGHTEGDSAQVRVREYTPQEKGLVPAAPRLRAAGQSACLVRARERNDPSQHAGVHPATLENELVAAAFQQSLRSAARSARASFNASLTRG